MKTIRQIIEFDVPPEKVYEALMSSDVHSIITNSKAEISTKVGGKFSTYDGGIFGKNIELIKNKKIAQEWYCETKGWPKDHFSKLTIKLRAIKIGHEKNGKEYFILGTELMLTQENVPDVCFEDVQSGWHEYYWKPMKKMFMENK